MPTRWFLSLEPSPGTVDAAHLHGLACALLEEPGDDHTARYKPFAAALPPSGLLSLTWLDEPTEPDIRDLTSEPLRLGGRLHRVAGVERHNVSYTRLASAPPANRVRVEFATPTYVNRADRQIPLPEPELLLAGLARRWDAFSPCPLRSAAVTEAVGRVHLSRHRVRSLPIRAGRGQRVGFVGDAVFGMPADADHEAVRAFTTLWLFAEFSGAGAQTTHGLGHVRVHRAERTRGPSEKRPGRPTDALPATALTP